MMPYRVKVWPWTVRSWAMVCWLLGFGIFVVSVSVGFVLCFIVIVLLLLFTFNFGFMSYFASIVTA